LAAHKNPQVEHVYKDFTFGGTRGQKKRKATYLNKKLYTNTPCLCDSLGEGMRQTTSPQAGVHHLCRTASVGGGIKCAKVVDRKSKLSDMHIISFV